MAALAAYDTAEETWGTSLEALGLAIAVLKKTKTRSWAELCATVPGTPTAKLLSGIELSPGQLSVLEVHRDVVSLLRVTPNAIPAICPVCELPILVDAAAPTTCTMSLRCNGKPVKPAAAKKVDIAPSRPPLEVAELEEVDSITEQESEPTAEPKAEHKPAVPYEFPDDDFEPDAPALEPAPRVAESEIRAAPQAEAPAEEPESLEELLDVGEF